MTDDLIAKLRAVKVRTPEEVMAQRELALDESCKKGLGIGALDDWITHWKRVEGKTLASMPDYYSWFKELKELQKYEPERVSGLLTTFRQEIGASAASRWLVTSTVVKYSMVDMEAKIVHHHGNQDLESTHRVDWVDHYHDCVIGRALPLGYSFLKTLLGTKDSAKEIFETLEFASGVSQDDILLRTLVQRVVPRIELSYRVATFSINNQFTVSATDFVASGGNSRGVRSDG